MLLPIQILHKLGSKDSIFPKAFENNNMYFFLEMEGGGGGGGRVECKTECVVGDSKVVIANCNCCLQLLGYH